MVMAIHYFPFSYQFSWHKLSQFTHFTIYLVYFYECHMHAWCLGGEMRVGTGVTDGRTLPGECWEYHWGGGSGRPVRALNHGAISPALALYFPMLKTNMENSLFTVGVNLSEGFSHPSSLCFFLLQSAWVCKDSHVGSHFLCWSLWKLKKRNRAHGSNKGKRLYIYISLPLHDHFLPNS